MISQKHLLHSDMRIWAFAPAAARIEARCWMLGFATEHIHSWRRGMFLSRYYRLGEKVFPVNFVTALAYHFCLALLAAFTQSWDHLLAKPSSIWNRNSQLWGTNSTWWELWKQMAVLDHMSEISIKIWTKWRKIILHEIPFRSGPSKNWTCHRKELISEEEMSESQCIIK